MINYALAQSQAQLAAQGFLAKINDAILFPLITLLMVLALVIFLYGAFEYVKNATSEQGRETGRQHLMWGIIGMLIMLSAYAILSIAANTFGLQNDLNKATNSSSTSPFAPTTSPLPIARPDITAQP